MCGLFGELGAPVLTDPVAIARISDTLHHRGPDAVGGCHGTGWMLGFRRLAILDLSPAGNQPMRSSDGRYVLAFNGEIYNYLELRAELENCGERFETHTDTEVLLRMLSLHGTAALKRLNGMFALAFLDLARDRYLLARDRLGVKPLHLQMTDGALRFASELQALACWPGAERGIDEAAVAEYLSLGYVPETQSIRPGHVKLPAGSYVEGDIAHPNIITQAWWHCDIAPDETLAPGDDAALLEELDALLAEATALRCRSDVPVALLLSGGIDSGLVASYMAQGAKRSGAGTPLALVAGFDGAPQDESVLARETAAHLGLDVQVLSIGSPRLSDVDDIARTYDEPFADPSALPMLQICRAARAHATVLLTGDGGDEAFAGYRRYLSAARFAALARVPEAARRLAWSLGRNRVPPGRVRALAKATLPGDRVFAVWDGLGLGRDPALTAMLDPRLRTLPDLAPSVSAIWAGTAGRDLLSRQRQFDYAHYLPGDVLTKVDRASMAASTEARSPFLDVRIVEFASRLPRRLLMTKDTGKIALRQLAAQRLPPRVATAQKSGFGVPVGAWLRDPAGVRLLRAQLTDPAANPDRIWSETGVAAALDDHLTGRRDHGEYFWRLLVLESWLRQSREAATT